jgi:hypothetical protein
VGQSTAYATVMVEVPLDEMIQRADTTCTARSCSSVRRDDAERNARAADDHHDPSDRVDRGAGGDTVTIREWRRVAGRRPALRGHARYRVGEEVIVFLERRPEQPRDLRTMAMVQGKFVVRHGVPGVPASVARDLEGIAFYRWIDGQQRISAPGRDPAMELGIFLEHVRRVRRDR